MLFSDPGIDISSFAIENLEEGLAIIIISLNSPFVESSGIVRSAEIFILFSETRELFVEPRIVFPRIWGVPRKVVYSTITRTRTKPPRISLFLYFFEWVTG